MNLKKEIATSIYSAKEGAVSFFILILFSLQGFSQPAIPDSTKKDSAAAIVPPPVTPSPDASKTDSTKKKTSFVNDNIEAYFREDKIQIKEAEPVTNILVVRNKKKDSLEFFVGTTAPLGWKAVNTHRMYRLAQNDSVFIPVYLLSANLMSSSNYLINSFIFSKDSSQIGNIYFIAVQRKTSRWKITSSPDRLDYIPFGKDTSHFNLHIINTGNGDENLKLSILKRDKIDDVHFFTPDEKPLNTSTIFPLKPGDDTTLNLFAHFNGRKRNFRRVDVESYIPHSYEFMAKDFPVYFQANEVAVGGKLGSSQTKLTFRKLPNILKLNPNSYYGVPITFQTDVYGMFSPFLFMNLFLYGETHLSDEEYFSYRFMIPLVIGSKSTIGQFIPYLGYFQKMGSVELGNISTGVIGSAGGQGIKLKYNLPSSGKHHHTIGAFYSESPYLRKGFVRLNCTE